MSMSFFFFFFIFFKNIRFQYILESIHQEYKNRHLSREKVIIFYSNLLNFLIKFLIFLNFIFTNFFYF